MADDVPDSAKILTVLTSVRRPVLEEELLHLLPKEEGTKVLDAMEKEGKFFRKTVNLPETSSPLYLCSARSVENATQLGGREPPHKRICIPGSTTHPSQLSASEYRTTRGRFRPPRKLANLSSCLKTCKGSLREYGGQKKTEVLTRDLLQIQKELDTTCDRLVPLQGKYSEKDVQSYIGALHEYNEVKDVAQSLLGKLAEMEGNTVASMHRQYGLSLDD